MQARNRRLAADLQTATRQLTAKDEAIRQMQERLAGLEQELQQKATLINSLEQDLLNLCVSHYSQSECSCMQSGGYN